MNLYLMCHTDAIPTGEHGVTEDEDRPLSERGLQQVDLLARGILRLELPLEMILHSPLRRAVQTARELHQRLASPQLKSADCKPLAPGHARKKLSKELLKLDAQHLLLVGHQPDLAEYAAWLTGNKDAQIELAPGGLACIACAGAPRKGVGKLLWLVTPEWLTAATSPPKRTGDPAPSRP
jgi:phosphohistidine phosphatase